MDTYHRNPDNLRDLKHRWSSNELRYGIGTIIAPNRVLTCCSLLSNAVDAFTRDVIDLNEVLVYPIDAAKSPSHRPQFAPYRICKVRKAKTCLAIPLKKFLSLNAAEQSDFHGLRTRHGGLVAKRFQTTAVDGPSKFGAWAQKAPFPPGPDLAILHFTSRNNPLTTETFPDVLRDRWWPSDASSPALAFAFGVTKIPFQDGRFRLVKVEMYWLDLSKPVDARRAPAIHEILDPEVNDPDPDVDKPELLDTDPRFPLIKMQGTAYPDMRGSPIFVSPFRIHYMRFGTAPLLSSFQCDGPCSQKHMVLARHRESFPGFALLSCPSRSTSCNFPIMSYMIE